MWVGGWVGRPGLAGAPNNPPGSLSNSLAVVVLLPSWLWSCPSALSGLVVVVVVLVVWPCVILRGSTGIVLGIVEGVLQVGTTNEGARSCAGYNAGAKAYECQGASNLINMPFAIDSQDFVVHSTFLPMGDSKELRFFFNADQRYEVNLNVGVFEPPSTARARGFAWVRVS